MSPQDKEAEIISMLPGDLKRIAEVVGIEATVKIGRFFRGTRLYIGDIGFLARELRDLKIRQDFDSGLNSRRLSIKYSLSERYIRKILGRPEQALPEVLSVLDVASKAEESG
ncbi:MAG: Mor transcription activator family protein [Thermodesulfovibrionales bacterium]|nr:Mor transcription activator family protein [Thermodesulfovibrionales bacterium]